MALTPEQAERLRLPHYPRAAAHDPHWVLEHLMGPNVLWLTEALTQLRFRFVSTEKSAGPVQ